MNPAPPLRLVHHVIGVEPERIIAGGPRQSRVAGRGLMIRTDCSTLNGFRAFRRGTRGA